jgi:hypothetical protein
MATKKGMTFNSDAAKSKWDALEDKAGASIDKLASGSATATDIKAVSSALMQMSNVASQVFEEAVVAAEKIMSEVDMSVGGKDVSDVVAGAELAMNEGAQKILQEAIAQIRDILHIELSDQSEDLVSVMGTKFETLTALLPKKNEAGTELVPGKGLKDELEKQTDDLLDRIYKMFGEKLAELKPTQPSGHVKGRRHVMNKYELRNLAEQGAALTGPEGEVATAEEVANATSTGSPVSQVSMPKGELTEEKTTSGDFDSLNSKLDRLMAMRGKGDESEDPEEKEDRKANSWWKSFKNWIADPIGTTKKKAKSFLDDNPWLELLGAGLLSMILDPQLWDTLVDKFKEYVTWDNIKGVAMDAWDTVTDLADKYLSWDNIKKVSSQVWDWLKTMGSDIYDWIKGAIHGKSPAVNAVKKIISGDLHKKAADEKSQGVGPVNVGYEAGEASREWIISKYGQLKNYFTGGDKNTTTNSSTTASPTINLSPNRSASTTPPTTSAPGTTSIRSGGIAVTPATTTTNGVQTPAQATGTVNQKTAVGTPNIGMGTFGFGSATNDQLMLMNVPGFMG